mmetsp:Transcript_8480/g.22926  ORF Transcript_8480/g.22926 Transcript_8480/m.22926 type:complete len:251 (+) Transcript_8480:41-793(+)
MIAVFPVALQLHGREIVEELLERYLGQALAIIIAVTRCTVVLHGVLGQDGRLRVLVNGNPGAQVGILFQLLEEAFHICGLLFGGGNLPVAPLATLAGTGTGTILLLIELHVHSLELPRPGHALGPPPPPSLLIALPDQHNVHDLVPLALRNVQVAVDEVRVGHVVAERVVSGMQYVPKVGVRDVCLVVGSKISRACHHALDQHHLSVVGKAPLGLDGLHVQHNVLRQLLAGHHGLERHFPVHWCLDDGRL